MIVIDEFVSASITGFENPTTQYLDKVISLDEVLIHNPSSTSIYAAPNSVYARGVAKGDWLVVNRALSPKHQDLLLVMVDGVLGVATLSYISHLKSGCDNIEVVGVVQQSVHFYRGAQTAPDHETLSDTTLHELLVEQDYSTVLARASGDSMMPHTQDRDLMIIERHLDYREGDVCVVAYNGSLVLKRVSKLGGTLSSDNPKFQTVSLQYGDRVSIEGVVNKVVRMHRV